MTAPATPESTDEIIALLRGTAHRSEQQPASRPGWMWPALTAGLGILGTGALTAAMLLPAAGQTPVASPAASATATPVAVAPTPTSSARPAAAGTSIAELADPAWVARIAAAGDIPERALAAYAGAALYIAETIPDCRLGWNTIAAIGFVETEHASMNGATLAADGTVAPAIIGVALDGDGTAEVRDTDEGRIDGDAVWDRAVGPFQFIPSTWALRAQDGNRDGAADINQIDDAALAAGMHLCEVGGDLSVPANWVAAISAYNASVEYNHRVAAAADSYATLP